MLILDRKLDKHGTQLRVGGSNLPQFLIYDKVKVTEALWHKKKQVWRVKSVGVETTLLVFQAIPNQHV